MNEHDSEAHRWLVVHTEELICARCTRCFKVAAKYTTTHVACDTCREVMSKADEWESGTCSCDPPPELPAGEELAKLVARALKKKSVTTVRARLTVRV